MNNYSFALKMNDTTFIFKYAWNMTVKYVRAYVNYVCKLSFFKYVRAAEILILKCHKH